jgi:hypothetical protein
LSYRDDLKAFRSQRNKRQRAVFKLIKINIIALAAALFLTAVLMVVDFATDSPDVDTKDRQAPVITLSDAAKVITSGDGTPLITLPSGENVIYLYVGEPVSWRSKVNISDDGGTFELKIDSSQVNTDVKGTYTVVYSATDTAGNTSQLSVKVIVTSKEYSVSKLYEEIGKRAASLGITAGMSTQDKVVAIYNYVNSPGKSADAANVKFVDESNIPAINRANWETDWIEEALRTLDSGVGDCYSYYSLSKAFFEYFGIENKGIVRDKSSSESGTHFWSMVNIGSEASPRWYFYDATRLNGSFSAQTKDNNGCLRTLDELKSYVTSKGGKEFYLFDESKYPKTATAKIPR